MSRLLRIAIGLPAVAALLFVASPPSAADPPTTPPVHTTPITAVCAVSGLVGFTGTYGINLHPTKNVYRFDSTSISCVDRDPNDATTVDGTFIVAAMGETTGVLETAVGTTGETCDEGHHTTEGTGAVNDTQAPHDGDTGTLHVFFQRFGSNVVAWGTFWLPTTGHKTFLAELEFIPNASELAAACNPANPGATATTVTDHGTGGPMSKITVADLVGEATVFATPTP
jgi:hypothetical protein